MNLGFSGACRHLLARLIPLALIVAVLPAAFLLGSNGAAAAPMPDPIAGDWNVTYGAPAVVTMTLAGGEYAETAKTPVEVVGSSCFLPAGTVISTFTQTGPDTYAGQHGLWFTNDCSFDTWAGVTLTLSSDGNTLTAVIGQVNETVLFTKGQRAFTVTGKLKDPPNSSQDTHAQAPAHSVCNPRLLVRYQDLGSRLVDTFDLIGAPDAADLLHNFLAGTFQPVNFQADSSVAQDILENPQFVSLNEGVQAEMQRQLNAGNTTVTLRPPTLRLIKLNQPLDLYLSFAGTQGLEVTGSGSLVNGFYAGTLKYTIEDNYGFSTDDHFLGLGDDMRYLQTVCGDPPYQGGAHWFPDSVTLTVNFSLPASSQ